MSIEAFGKYKIRNQRLMHDHHEKNVLRLDVAMNDFVRVGVLKRTRSEQLFGSHQESDAAFAIESVAQ
jgi:hypothetical protein